MILEILVFFVNWHDDLTPSSLFFVLSSAVYSELNTARAIATPIKGVVLHSTTTLPYSKFNNFKSPTAVDLGPDLELSSTVCVP